jgi:hypothetical protein
MIDRNELLAVANATGLTAPVVEKDYILGWLLRGISQHQELRERWLFKGGTCLKKCYFETYRFSEDLDFTLLRAIHVDSEFLQAAFAEVAARIYEEAGIEIPIDRMRFDVYQNPRGNPSCQGRLYYTSDAPAKPCACIAIISAPWGDNSSDSCTRIRHCESEES